jgi:hypothetical protein
MLRIVSTLVTSFILGLLLTTQSGCLLAVAAVGTGGTVAYVRGDLETSVDADPRLVADAADRALKGMDVAVISKSASSLDANVQGRTARDVKVSIVVKAESDKVSHVSVRVGVFGDNAMQANIMEKIRSELNSPTASAE